MTALVRGRKTGIIAIVAAIAIVATAGIGSAGVLSIFNKAPVAHDQSFDVNGTPSEVTLYATDAERNKLTYVITQEPQHGTLSGQAPSFLYTPVAGFTGTDTFTWRASDGMKSSNTGTASISNTSSEAPSEPTIGPLSHVSPNVVHVATRANAAPLVLGLQTSLTIARPPGTAVGDVMYLWAAFSAPTSLGDFISAMPAVPPGWVPVFGGDPTIAYLARGVLFSKIATAADLATPSYTITFPIPAQVAASISTFHGVDSRAPLWMIKSAGTLGTALTQPLVLPSVHNPDRSIEVVLSTSFGASLTNALPTQIARIDNGELLNIPVVSDLVHTELQGSIQARPVAGNTGVRIANFTGLLQPLALPLAAVGVHFTLRPAP